jgi:hypothetical protein
MHMVTEAQSAGGAEQAMFGTKIMALADRLAQWSEVPDGLTCTYLSPAHRSVAAEICDLMRQPVGKRHDLGSKHGLLGAARALCFRHHVHALFVRHRSCNVRHASVILPQPGRNKDGARTRKDRQSWTPCSPSG